MMNRLILIALLLLVNTAFGQKLDKDGALEPDIEWYVKDVRAQRYEIHTANELAGLAALVNGTSSFSAYNFYGKLVVLANDIDLNGHIDEAGVWQAPQWIPIGTNYSCHFAGDFDGQGFCIKNLVVRNTQTGSLFGYNGGTIKNLVIAGGMVSCDFYGAGVCSFNTGVVDHCINTANIYCNNYGGGICGKNYGNGKVTNCINLGYVYDGNYCGGVIGSNSTIPLGTTITNCVYDVQMCPLKKGCGNVDHRNVKNLTTAQIVSGQGYNANSFVLENGMYPRLEDSKVTPCLNAVLLPISLPATDNVMSVSKNITLPKAEGVSISSPSDSEYLQIEGDNCAFKKRAPVLLLVNGGGCTRLISMRVTSSDLDMVGTQSQPIRIYSYDDLLCFANAVNNSTHFKGLACINGFRDMHFALAQCVHIPDGVNWTPIGTVSSPFCGTFNGLGCVISNINIRRPTQKYCGLFGYCSGKIQRLIIVGGQIIGGDYTGGVCGYLNGGVLEQCLSAVPVRGHYYTGGVLGFSNVSKLLACIYVNSVQGQPEYSGAVCGGGIDGTIRHCAFDSKICTGYPAVGQADGVQMMHTFGYRTEAMVGSNMQMLYSAYQKDFYWDNQMYPVPVSTGRYQEANVAATPIFIADNEDARNLKSYIILSEIDGITYTCDQTDVLKVNPDIAFPLKQGAVILAIRNGNVRKDITLRIVNKAIDPVGSAENPLMISSFSDLDKLRTAVNYGTDYKGYACIEGFKGVCFKLANNIFCPAYDNQNPVGNNLFPFCGVFDGNGKLISNFNCQNEDMDNVGVFGYNAGVIKNLRVIRSPVKGRYYAGGICGYNAGHIEFCSYENSQVIGSNYVGGVCGFDEGTILKCANTGEISSDYYAGGIAGSGNGRIDTCTNNGIVNGISCVGGIVGINSAPITFSFNHASVKGNDNVGGISGRNSYSDVFNCVNDGVVKGRDCSGGIVGLNDGNIKGCTNEASVTSMNSCGGIAGRGGKIIACINKASASSTLNTVGGIVGSTKPNSLVERCVNYGNVKSSQSQAGGITAENQGSIQYCVNFGDVDAAYFTGGISGVNSGKMTSCVSSAQILGQSQAGAICAQERDESVIEKCVFNTDLTDRPGLGTESENNGSAKIKTQGLNTGLLQNRRAMNNQVDLSGFEMEDGKYPLPRLVDEEPEEEQPAAEDKEADK